MTVDSDSGRELTAEELLALAELERAESADASLRKQGVIPTTPKGLLERMDIGEAPSSINSEPSSRDYS
jgi:hypothetical protein